jgi:hypothetical protein
MANLISITLAKPHRVLGSLQAIGAQCSIHKGVADDLVERKIAKLTDEPTKAKRKSGGGE